jgi:hypothetical protein
MMEPELRRAGETRERRRQAIHPAAASPSCSPLAAGLLIASQAYDDHGAEVIDDS